MPMIGPRTGIAFRQKRVKLSAPGVPVPDGDGGYTLAEGPLDPPAVWAYVTPASKGDLERLAGGTVLTQATHLVSLPYHAQVNTNTVLAVEDYPRADRTMRVVFVGNPDERNARLELICSEVVA